jgi:hypothetical protein
MDVELGDDVACHVRGVGSIYFQKHLGVVLELDNVLFVLA